MASQIGTINLQAVELNGRSLYDGFVHCSIYEDIFTNSWSGHIDIGETESIRESMPIIGEEVIVIRFASNRPVEGASDSTIQFIGRITKLTDFREGTASQRYYRLHFQSLWAENNRAKRCRKVYEGTGTEIASKILNAQMGHNFITLDPAKYSEKFIFPNWTPFQCINYLAGVSVSKRYADPAYMFYEDREGFHLTSLSQMMDKEIVDTVKIKIVQSPEDTVSDEYLVSVLKFDPLFDTLENDQLGMYGGTLISYDKVNKSFKEEEETYSGTYDEYKHVGKEKLTVFRPESPKNRFQFLMSNNTVNPGVYSNPRDWALKGLIRAQQQRGHRVHLYLNRSTDFKLGDLLAWDINSTTDNEKPDSILSGKWMITRIRHTFSAVNYNAHVELIKDGIG